MLTLRAGVNVCLLYTPCTWGDGRGTTDDKPLRTFSYQTEPWVLLTLGTRSPLAAQRRHYGSNAKTARGKAVQHIMLSNFAAGRFFESLEPSKHCSASDEA